MHASSWAYFYNMFFEGFSSSHTVRYFQFNLVSTYKHLLDSTHTKFSQNYETIQTGWSKCNKKRKKSLSKGTSEETALPSPSVGIAEHPTTTSTSKPHQPAKIRTVNKGED